MTSRRSLTERVAMELRQIDSEGAAEVAGNPYPLTRQQSWDRIGEALRDQYRHDARRILRVIAAGPNASKEGTSDGQQH